MKNHTDWSYQSAAELVAALANKKISSVELLEQTIARIEHIDKKINAVVVKDFDRAHTAAKEADKAIARGEKKLLLGLPITVKESFNVAGLPTTWGNTQYKNWRPNDDALLIARLKAAGAIIIGKTNVAPMLHDWQSYNDVYGTTNNPWNIHVTPGGSSGGSAAALACGFVSLEVGSDLCGSLRVPANFCGVFAHKPTQDLVPLRGAGPPTTLPSPNRVDLSVAGPMARTATDLVLALDIMAGPDEWLDGKGYQLLLPPPRHHHLKNFRVLILDTHPLCPTANIIKKSIENLSKQLIKLGVTVSHETKKLPDLAQIAKNYSIFLTSFGSGSVPIEVYEKSKAVAEKLSPNDTSLYAYRSRGFVISHRDWLIETRIRGELRQQWRNLFKEFDVILCPVMPTPAFPHDHSDPEKRQIEIDGVFVPYMNQMVWHSIATLFGLPATVMPIGLSENNLPLGIQVIGDYLEDYTTIQFARLLERELAVNVVPFA